MNDFEREWSRQLAAEKKYIAEREKRGDSRLNAFLQTKVPEKLKDTLDTGFAKAFELIFAKGTGVIEKTYNRRDIERSSRVRRIIAKNNPTKRALRDAAGGSSAQKTKNTVLSGVSGIGMGLIGVGIPDIPVFTAMLLKSLYEISLGYGYDYDEMPEKYFILLIIGAALRYGDELRAADERVNYFIEHGAQPDEETMKTEVRIAAEGLSGELLYMKFLQGIPIVGAVGGAYDPIYIDRITRYADMKYKRRFLHDIKNR